jgi:hypothetical protein
MMYVFKEGSSVLFVISSAVCLPLTDVLYMIPILAGPLAKQTFTIFDGFALFIIMVRLSWLIMGNISGTGLSRISYIDCRVYLYLSIYIYIYR